MFNLCFSFVFESISLVFFGKRNRDASKIFTGFRGRRSTLDRRSGKIAKRIWYKAVSAALNFPFLKDVSQNCFVFDVVKFQK